MQTFRFKSFGLVLAFCLLPFGLRAQTAPAPIVISDAQTTPQALAAGRALTVEAAGSLIFTTGTPITGAGTNTIDNSGTISSRDSIAIDVTADTSTINNSGTIQSFGTAIQVQSLNVITNSGEISSIRYTGTPQTDPIIRLQGIASSTMLAANPTAPAYNASEALRDAYYFNNKIVNEEGGRISSTGLNDVIRIDDKRAQVINHGTIEALGSSGSIIAIPSGASQILIVNIGTMTSAFTGIHASSGSGGELVIFNTGDIVATGIAIWVREHNLIVNSGNITGGSHGISLAGNSTDATMEAANPTAPAWSDYGTPRDAYYFNNKIVNEAGGVITGRGTSHGIHVSNKRAQIFNHGTIIAEGTGHGIYFNTRSGDSLVVNTGTISAAAGWGIYAHDNAENIVVINNGTITGVSGAIRMSGGDDTLIVGPDSTITGAVDFRDGSGDELVYAEGVDRPTNNLSPAPTNLETTSNSGIELTEPLLSAFPLDRNGELPPNGELPSDGELPLSNYETLFHLGDNLILDLNASVQTALYDHNFSLTSETESTEEFDPWWIQGFGSFRKQDASEHNAQADHTLGGLLLGYDFARDQDRNFGWFLGAALGSLDAEDSTELADQSFFGGLSLNWIGQKNFFFGLNFLVGFTSHESERSVEELDTTVKIKGEYKGYFLSPELTLGIRMQNSNIVPSLRVRYLFASFEDYAEDGTASDRISAEKRNTGTLESRAQLAFPLYSVNQAWSFEPRLGFEYRAKLSKNTFDVETVATGASIDYDPEKEKALGIFGGFSAQYLTDNTNFKFNVDVISSDESLVLRAQAGFGFRF